MRRVKQTGAVGRSGPGEASMSNNVIDRSGVQNLPLTAAPICPWRAECGGRTRGLSPCGRIGARYGQPDRQVAFAWSKVRAALRRAVVDADACLLVRRASSGEMVNGLSVDGSRCHAASAPP